MNDSNGTPVTVGQKVQFKVEGRRFPVIGTVRAIKNGEARCDDGAPDNPDLLTNGFHCSAWVPPKKLAVIP